MNTSHVLAPTYRAWALDGGASAIDGVFGGTTAVSGSGTTSGLNAFSEACADFSGSGDYPSIAISTSQNFTVIARINPDVSDGNFRTILASATQGLFLQGGGPRFYSFGGTGSGVSVGTWVTLGFSNRVASNDARYYIDGVGDLTTATLGSAFNTTAGIGGHGSERFDGRIDYVFVWDRVLSDAEHLAVHGDPFQVYGSGSAFNALLVMP